jgi:hypothetical protein
MDTDDSDLENLWPISEKQYQRSDAFLIQGDISKAMKALRSAKVASMDDVRVKQEIVSKFPRHLHRPELPEKQSEDSPLIKVTQKEVESAAKNQKRNTTAGLSPSLPETWTKPLLKDSAVRQALLSQFTTFMNKIYIPGAFSRPWKKFLNSGRLIPIKQGDKHRPIVTGDAFNRLCTRVAIQSAVIQEYKKTLPPQQFSTLKDGSVTMAVLLDLCLKNRLDVDPDTCLMSVDNKNAYNQPFHHAIYHALQRTCPELVSLFLMSFGGTTDMVPQAVYVREHIDEITGQKTTEFEGIPAERGVFQGNPASPLFYICTQLIANAQTDLITGHRSPRPGTIKIPVDQRCNSPGEDPTHLPDELVDELVTKANMTGLRDNVDPQDHGDYNRFGYLDDQSYIGHAETLAYIHALDQTVYERFGMELQPTKSVTLHWNKECSSENSQMYKTICPNFISIGHSEESKPTAEQGVTIVGRPFGHPDFIQAGLQKKVRDYTEIGRILQAHPTLQHAYILFQKSLVHMPVYFLRTIPDEYTEEFATQLDTLFHNTLTKLLRHTKKEMRDMTVASDPERHPQQEFTKIIEEGYHTMWRLPYREGGMAIPSMINIRKIAHTMAIISVGQHEVDKWELGLDAFVTSDLNQLDTTLPNQSHCQSTLGRILTLKESLTTEYGDEGKELSLVSVWDQTDERNTQENRNSPLTIKDLARVNQTNMTRTMAKLDRSRLTKTILHYSDEPAAINLLAHLQSNRLPDACRAVAVLPITPTQRFNNRLWINNLRLRAGLPPAFLNLLRKNCRNNCRANEQRIPVHINSPITDPWHYLHCMSTNREDRINSQYALAHKATITILKKFIETYTNLIVVLEPTYPSDGVVYRADMRISNMSDGKTDVVVDVSSTCPLARSFRRQAATKEMGTVLEMREKKKAKKYKKVIATHDPEAKFLALAIETTGGMGKQFREFIEVICSEIHDASAYSIAPILRERLRNQICAVHRKCFLNPAIQCAMAGARIGSTTKTFESERFFMYDELPDE